VLYHFLLASVKVGNIEVDEGWLPQQRQQNAPKRKIRNNSRSEICPHQRYHHKTAISIMPQQKYGKRRQNHQLFDFSPFLASSSPETASDIEQLTSRLDHVNLSTKEHVRRPLNIRDQNIPSPPPREELRKRLHHSVEEKSCHDPLVRLLDLSTDPQHRLQPEHFHSWSQSLECFFDIIKIAEASYGEVYRLKLKSNHPEFNTSDESVLKILALKPEQQHEQRNKSNAQAEKESLMSSIDNVIAEVKLLQRMVDIPGFTNFRDIRVLKGRPSKAFATAWKKFNSERSKNEKSIFPDPSKKASYSEDQMWAVIEMQDAGTDLERIKLNTVWTIWDVFWSVVLALAKAEQEAEFEHRDLHMGNICVKVRNGDNSLAPEKARIKDFKKNLDFSGLESTIIDYTLSRAETAILNQSSEEAESRVEFLDLATESSLFEADATDEYQYEIYRYMRSAMYFSDPLADYKARKHEVSLTGRSWAGFHPQTNLIWLHFVLRELLKTINWPTKNMKATLEHVDLRDKEDEKAAKKKSKDLEIILKHLRQLLTIKNIPTNGLASARDLVAISLEKGWLDEDDVVGHMDSSFASLV
jgi:serine/threonine-protein kinase haspin